MKDNQFIKQTAISLTLMSLAVAAHATAPLPSGWYAEANGGSSRNSNISYPSGTSTSNTGLGWNFNAGYKLLPFAAIEAGYTHYAKTTVKANGTQVASTTHYSYDAAIRGILPLGDSGGELFAKLGAAQIKAKTTISIPGYASANTGSYSATGYYFGLGGNYYFLPNAAINAQWQRAKGNSNTGNLDLFSLGLSYLFS